MARKAFLLTRVIDHGGREEDGRIPCAVYFNEAKPPRQAVLENIPAVVTWLARKFCPNTYNNWIETGDQNLQILIDVLIKILSDETIKELIYDYYDVDEIDIYEDEAQ